MIHEGIKKIEKIQGFTTIDLITFVMTVLAAVILVFPIIMKHSSRASQTSAQAAAQEISKDLLEDVQIQIRAFEQSSEARSLASVSSHALSWEGIVSADPWGNPYHYRILKDIYGRPTHLVVWSLGENAKQDTSEFEFDSEIGIVKFKGDDVGHIRSL